MQRSTRRRLRVLAWGVFLVAAPLLLAYVRGYRLPEGPLREWNTPGQPAVGALVIRTVPRGASVTVEGRLVDERSPTGLGSVAAGTHTIRIEKAGYRPYERQLVIEGGRVTDLLHVRLIPEDLEEDILIDQARLVWLAADKRWMIVRTTQGIRLLSVRDGVPADVMAAIPLPSKAHPLAALASPDGERVALGVAVGEGRLDGRGVIDLRSGRWFSLPPKTRLVGWTRTGPTRLILQDDHGALLSWADSRKPLEILADGVTASAIHPRGILVQRREGPETLRVALWRPSGEPVPLLPSLDVPVASFAVSPRGAIAARTVDGALSILPPESGEWRTLTAQSLAVQWSPDGNKLLYQETEFDIGVVNISEERSVLPPLQPTLLRRVSSPIEELRWFPDSQHLLFFEQDIIQLLDIDPRGGSHLTTLASTNLGASPLAVTGDGEELFFSARRLDREVTARLFLFTKEDR